MPGVLGAPPRVPPSVPPSPLRAALGAPASSPAEPASLAPDRLDSPPQAKAKNRPAPNHTTTVLLRPIRGRRYHSSQPRGTCRQSATTTHLSDSTGSAVS